MMIKTQSKRIWQVVAVLMLALSAVVLTMALASASAPAAANAGQWVTECIDCVECVDCNEGYSVDNRRLRLDANDHPHLVYVGDALYYAYFDGQRWYFDTIDNSPARFSDADLELDNQGWPNISYLANGSVKFARWTGSQWLIQTISSQASGIGAPALDLDSAGNPHIVFSEYVVFPDRDEHRFKYARWTGSEWDIQIVLHSAVSDPDLEVDAAGNLHIGYVDWSLGPESQLNYLYWDGSSSITQVIDSSYYGVWALSLELDQTGTPRIAYAGHMADYGASPIWSYAYLDGNNWVTQTVATNQSIIWYGINLALDSAGYPHVSYTEYLTSTGQQLIGYAYLTDTGWVFENNIAVGGGASLALDRNDTPHLGYAVGLTHRDIRYGKRVGTNWHFETLVPRNAELGVPSMDIDQNGDLHLVYPADQELRYGYRTGNAWSFQSVASNIANYDVAVDQNNHPYICYLQGQQMDCLNWTGSAWITPTTMLPGMVVHPSGFQIQLDSSGFPHTLGYSAGVFSHIYWTGTAWAIQDILEEDGFVSVYDWALDSQDRPHVLYESDACTQYFSTYEIIYTYWNGSGWETQELISCDHAAGGFVGGLSLDGQDQPHVIYSGDDTGNWLYAHWDGTQWDSMDMNIGSASNFAFLDFVLNTAGFAQVVYCSATPETGMWFAWLPPGASNWQMQIVYDDGQACATAAAIAATSAQPYISYLDQNNNDLKLAYFAAQPLSPTPTPTPGLPWVNWQDPEQPLFVPPQGANAVVEYGNLPISIPLTASLTSPIQFGDGTQEMEIVLPNANGQIAFPLVPISEAEQGAAFTFGITANNVYLEKQGIIAWAQYFPLLQR